VKAGFIGCGAGLLAKAMEDAGIEIAWGIDIDELNLSSFHENFPNAKIHLQSITEFEELPEADIWAVTLPCQSFSHANQNREEDPTLILYAMYLIYKQKPKFWFVENSPNAAKWFPSTLRSKVFKMCQFGNKQQRKRMFLANFDLGLLSPCICKEHVPAVTKSGNGNGRYYGYTDYETALERMGFKDKGLILLGNQSQKKAQLGEGVVYEFGYFVAKKILEVVAGCNADCHKGIPPKTKVLGILPKIL